MHNFYHYLFAVFASIFSQVCLSEATCRMSNEATSEKVNSFGFDVYRRLSQTPGNVFFSPISISFALAMTSLGARSATLDEILAAMKTSLTEKDVMHSWFKEAKECLFSEQENFTLAIANKLFAEKSYTFLDAFLEETSEHYGSSLEALDFKENAEESRKQINNWVSGITMDKIKDLLAPDNIDSLTRLVLVNAIYFKGQWREQFLANRTSDQDFFVGPEEKITVATMHAELQGKHGFSVELESDVLELPYEGDRLSLLVILPRLSETSLHDVEDKLTGSVLSSLSLYTGKVEVHLPKFKMEPSYDMKQKMSDLGVKSLFAGEADLSGIDGTRTLFVSAMVHKAFIEVNEEGTEAAAATAVAVTFRSRPIVPEFKVNHPFLFLIHDKQSQAVLFLGRCIRP